jgi:multiple sugar transport system ATP-binding protein
VAMVFQNYALYPHMTVFENLAFALKIRDIAKDEIRSRVESAAALLDLSDHLQKKPAHLSGGQRQRVALGRAIIRKPALFLLDEPLSNLDAELRMRMRSELLAIHRRIAGTSLYVTHDQVEAMSLADKIVILNKGQQIGPENPRTLYDNPPDTFTASFLGNPGMNLLEGTIDSTGKRVVLSDAIIINIAGEELPGKEIIYGFRPEKCKLANSGQIPVEAIGYEDAGKEYIIELTGPKGARIFCLSDKKPSVGEHLFLTADTAYLFDRKTSQSIKTLS